MFRNGEVRKTYWAMVQTAPNMPEATLTNWLVRNEKQNKSYVYNNEMPNAKQAILKYKTIGQTEHYTLLEVNLLTGRHHQIRCQLAAMGCPIKGDLKYGARRSNPDGSISLLSHKVEFIHPVSKQKIVVVSPLPTEKVWENDYSYPIETFCCMASKIVVPHWRGCFGYVHTVLYCIVRSSRFPHIYGDERCLVGYFLRISKGFPILWTRYIGC